MTRFKLFVVAVATVAILLGAFFSTPVASAHTASPAYSHSQYLAAVHDNSCAWYQEHCNWLLKPGCFTQTSGFAILDATTNTWHQPSDWFPNDMQNQGCTAYGNTQFGVHTTWATLNPGWMQHTWILYW